MVVAQLKLEWQEGKDKQENEIVAIPKLLGSMDIAGATVTIDAIGTQVDIAERGPRQGRGGRLGSDALRCAGGRSPALRCAVLVGNAPHCATLVWG